MIIQFPPDSFLATVAKLTPHSHALEAFRVLMVDNGTLLAALPQVGLLAAVGLAFFTVAMLRFRFEP